MATPLPRKKEIKGLGLSGLTWSSMKKYPAVIPIYVFLAAGVGLAGWYTYRLATKSPEVMWRRKSNPEPWNAYSNKQYKLLGVGRDYSVGTPAPNYKE